MDLSTLLSESQALTAHLAPNDIPSIHLGLEQIEAQSRRLVSRQAAATGDTGKASYLLAQAQVDAGTLANNIASLNTATTFAPLQPLHDTDVAGFLRHAHEQNIISTIEEGRRETLLEFRHVLDERFRRDWEQRKKKIFEELGERSSLLANESRKGSKAAARTGSRDANMVDQQQARMMAYDSTIASFNAARLAGVAYPLLRNLMEQTDPSFISYQTFQLLASIVDESPGLPSAEHLGAHIPSVGSAERKYARAYLGDPDRQDAKQLRRQIAAGAQRSLEVQYWDIITRTIAARPQQAALGGDPSVAAHVKAYLNVKFYHQGAWEDRLELIVGQPLWAKLFYLIRTGHIEECLQEALLHENAISLKERHFVSYLKAWINSPTRTLTRSERNPLQASYNSHILHSPTTDPFKLALYKIIGKFDPNRRAVPLVTATTEDWLWLQLAMLDEDNSEGLRGLADVLMGYGERHFEPTGGKGKRGAWARVLVMCGQFERAVAAMYEIPELQVDSVHFAVALAYYGLLRVPSKSESSDVDIISVTPSGHPVLNLALLISRYIRQFIRIEPQVALQYVYCLCLSADQEPAGTEQVEVAWELTRRVILMAEVGGGWADLVGGYRPDGTRFTGIIERDLKLLKLDSSPTAFATQILTRAARQSEREKRTTEAIRLYHLAGEHETVVECLARALGDQISEPVGGGGDDEGLIETAREVLQHYERTNKAGGKAREAVSKLVRIRDARVAKDQGMPERALEYMESTGIFPVENDITTINKKAQQLRDYDEVIVRNLQFFLPLHMDILVELRNRRRATVDSTSLNSSKLLTEKALALQKFATNIKYSMSPDVHTYLSRSVVDLMN